MLLSPGGLRDDSRVAGDLVLGLRERVRMSSHKLALVVGADHDLS